MLLMLLVCMPGSSAAAGGALAGEWAGIYGFEGRAAFMKARFAGDGLILQRHFHANPWYP